MKKKIFATLLLVVTLLPITVTAEDLPIDINAIGRQHIEHQINVRIGEGLFSEDSAIVNAAQHELIRRRQDTALELFSYIPDQTEIDTIDFIISRTNSVGLFSVPTNYSHIVVPPQPQPLSTGIIIATIGICVVLGFVATLIYRKKKERETDAN